MPYYKQELPKHIHYALWKEKWVGLIKRFVSFIKNKNEKEKINLPDNKDK
jgi:hypothetical protein